MSDLKIWLQRKTNDSVVLVNGEVDEWLDISGNGNNFKALYASTRPIDVAGGVKFENTGTVVASHVMELDDPSPMQTYPFTVFAKISDVSAPATLDAGRTGVISAGGPSDETRFWDAATTLGAETRDEGAPVSANLAEPVGQTITEATIRYVFAAADDRRVKLNDEAEIVNTSNFEHRTTSRILLGAIRAGLAGDNAFGFNGTINEIQVFSGIVDEMQSVPITPEEIFNATYATASAAPPKRTALVRPLDVQRSIDTDVSWLAGNPKEWTLEVIIPVGELQYYRPGNVFFVRADVPGLRDGRKVLLKGFSASDIRPTEPVTCVFTGPSETT